MYWFMKYLCRLGERDLLLADLMSRDFSVSLPEELE